MYYLKGINRNLIFLYDGISLHYNVFQINHNFYKKDQSDLWYMDFNNIVYLLNKTPYNLHNHELWQNDLNFTKICYELK